MVLPTPRTFRVLLLIIPWWVVPSATCIEQQTTSPQSFITCVSNRRRTGFPSCPDQVPRLVSCPSETRQCLPPPCTVPARFCSSECEVISCLPNGLKPSSGRCNQFFLLALGRQCASRHVCTSSRCVISTRGPSLPPAKQHSPLSLSSVTESSAAVLLGCFHWCFWVAPESYPERGNLCASNACYTVMSRLTALHRSPDSDVGEVLGCKAVYEMCLHRIRVHL